MIHTDFNLSLLQLCKYDIEQSISREMSGDFKTGMLTTGWFCSLNRNSAVLFRLSGMYDRYVQIHQISFLMWKVKIQSEKFMLKMLENFGYHFLSVVL